MKITENMDLCCGVLASYRSSKEVREAWDRGDAFYTFSFSPHNRDDAPRFQRRDAVTKSDCDPGLRLCLYYREVMQHIRNHTYVVVETGGRQDSEAFKAAMEAMKEPHAIKQLRFIIAPENGACEATGANIPRGITCLERIQNDGTRSWFSIGSERFKWWVLKRTNLSLDKAQRGLCNHGLLAECEQCREITPGWNPQNHLAPLQNMIDQHFNR